MKRHVMRPRSPRGQGAIRLPALAVAALASFALLLASTPAAHADTTFGSDPAQEVTPLSCTDGAPIYIEIYDLFWSYEGTAGSPSCMWSWSNTAVGTDIVPFPPTGGTGTVTSVTLPAMPNPGPMAVVVLTSALNAGSSPSHPDYVCCQVKQVGPTFTVPPNQVTTVAQSLHVSATEEADLSVPGDTSFGDLVGVAVLSPGASLPVRYTGATDISNADVAFAYYPAPGGANPEYKPPFNEYGFQLLARFTMAIDAREEEGEEGEGEGGPAGGVKLIGGPLRVAGNGKTVTLGKAANPPTARTTQTLTVPATARVARASARGKKAARKRKRVVLGRGRTRVASGKAAKLRLRLNGRGRARLKKKGRLKARLTVVAVNAAGEKQTLTRRVTVKPAKRRRR